MDQLEFWAALLLVLLLVASPWLEHVGQKLAVRTGLCLLLLAGLPVILRLFLLPSFPIPTPYGSDDFSHLLVADTLSHFRLANPVHPFHRFFEAIFVLQEPSYSSMYPPGLGLFLALGRLLFGTPWAGMVILDAAFCALCYWALRAWVTPGWALAGGLLAIFEFGPLNQWIHIWAYKDAGERERVRAEAVKRGIWPPPKTPPGLLVKQENMLVVPAAFSPLK